MPSNTAEDFTLTWPVELISLTGHAENITGPATSETFGDGRMGVTLYLETGNQLLTKKSIARRYFSLESGRLNLVIRKNHSSATKVCVFIDSSLL